MQGSGVEEVQGRRGEEAQGSGGEEAQGREEEEAQGPALSQPLPWPDAGPALWDAGAPRSRGLVCAQNTACPASTCPQGRCPAPPRHTPRPCPWETTQESAAFAAFLSEKQQSDRSADGGACRAGRQCRGPGLRCVRLEPGRKPSASDTYSPNTAQRRGGALAAGSREPHRGPACVSSVPEASLGSASGTAGAARSGLGVARAMLAEAVRATTGTGTGGHNTGGGMVAWQ